MIKTANEVRERIKTYINSIRFEMDQLQEIMNDCQPDSCNAAQEDFDNMKSKFDDLKAKLSNLSDEQLENAEPKDDEEEGDTIEETSEDET